MVRSVGGGVEAELFARGGDVEDKNAPNVAPAPDGGFREKVLSALI